jgi:hypothetical protein
MKKPTKEQMKTAKLIVVTSLVWITIAAVAVGFIKYGEYKYTDGMVKGFQEARATLNK